MEATTFDLIAKVLGPHVIGDLLLLDKREKLNKESEFVRELQVRGEYEVRVLSMSQRDSR